MYRRSTLAWLASGLVAAGCGRSEPDEATHGQPAANAPVHDLCFLPLGHLSDVQAPPSEAISDITLCDEGFGGGFRFVTGHGSKDLAGYPATFDCSGRIGVEGTHTPFWRQVGSGLDAKGIAHSGAAAHWTCADWEFADLAVDLGDWRDTDAASVVILEAMKQADLCGTLALDVRGPGCVRPVGG